MNDQAIAPHDFCEAFLAEYDLLYDRLFKARFAPALENLTKTLIALLDESFSESQRMRLRVERGRVKSANRLLLKAQTQKYRALVETPADVFKAIRDIVGTRVTCNTLSDVYAVVETIKTCALAPDQNRTLLKLDEDWEDDYIKNPKESGYRAINLIVGVPVATGARMEPITCEVQVRTLLQHAWGELSHEDTYKPGVKVPELVQILSKRLATTLAVLDEIAQDLRNELVKSERLEAPAAKSHQQGPDPDALAQEVEETGPAVGDSQEGPLVPAIGTADVPEDPRRQQLSLAFQDTFGRGPIVDDSGVDEVFPELEKANLADGKAIALALAETREFIEAEEARLSKKATLTDFGRLRAAAKFRENPDQGKVWITETLQTAANEVIARESQFCNTYYQGRATLGTVVRVSGTYALVRLPEGHTGILHVTGMGSRRGGHRSARHFVREGETVRVRVRGADASSQRIELQLLRR